MSGPDLAQRMALLQRWLRRYPGALPTRSTTVPLGGGEVFELGVWVMNLRAAWRCGHLPQDQRQALEALPGWAWDADQALFPARAAAGYLDLIDHVHQLGHARPHPRTRAGRFLSARRADMRAGRLREDQVRALEALPGFTWSAHSEMIEPVSQIPWILYRRVLELLARHGRVDLALVEQHLDGASIGWVRGIVQDHRDGRADEALVQLFSALPGWRWPKSPEGDLSA